MRADLLIDVLLITCAIPANLYPAFYMFRPWWITPQGRALMVKALGNAMLIDLGLSVVIWGDDYLLRPVVRTVAFTLFAVGVWYLFVALLRSDRDHRYPPRSWLRQWRRTG
jgi:hypothetical protein